jgi:predicted lipoprotein with Yx(FWY)xxD motif
MMTRLALFASTLISALGLAAGQAFSHGPAVDQEGRAALHVAQHQEHGEYLIDHQGRALYLFEADTRGQGDQEAVSNCYDDCATAWPPLLTEGTPETHDAARSDFLGTIERKDGGMQVTYGGWPLYYYAADVLEGHTRGHDIEHSGAEWYLVTPEGEKAGEDH